MNYLEKISFAREIISNALNKYSMDKVVLASSFGKDSIVLKHIVLSIQPEIPVITLISDTEFEETYAYIDRIIKKWSLNCKCVYFKQEEFVKKNLDLCCKSKKVEAMKEAISESECWISGIRQSESELRSNILPIEHKQGLVKVNPLLHFSELDIWRYIGINKIEVNPLYAEGYRSLGCKICSKPEVLSSEQERDGRWGGLSCQGGECGIHLEKLK